MLNTNDSPKRKRGRPKLTRKQKIANSRKRLWEREKEDFIKSESPQIKYITDEKLLYDLYFEWLDGDWTYFDTHILIEKYIKKQRRLNEKIQKK